MRRPAPQYQPGCRRRRRNHVQRHVNAAGREASSFMNFPEPCLCPEQDRNPVPRNQIYHISAHTSTGKRTRNTGFPGKTGNFPYMSKIPEQISPAGFIVFRSRGTLHEAYPLKKQSPAPRRNRANGHYPLTIEQESPVQRPFLRGTRCWLGTTGFELFLVSGRTVTVRGASRRGAGAEVTLCPPPRGSGRTTTVPVRGGGRSRRRGGGAHLGGAGGRGPIPPQIQASE